MFFAEFSVLSRCSCLSASKNSLTLFIYLPKLSTTENVPRLRYQSCCADSLDVACQYQKTEHHDCPFHILLGSNASNQGIHSTFTASSPLHHFEAVRQLSCTGYRQPYIPSRRTRGSREALQCYHTRLQWQQGRAETQALSGYPSKYYSPWRSRQGRELVCKPKNGRTSTNSEYGS